MHFSKVIYNLIIVLCLFSCGEEPDLRGSRLREPIFGFSKTIEGKEVKMTAVFDEKLSLIVSDSVKRSVQFISTSTGERLIVDDWSFDFEKAIKYKKYYFLHQLVDSSFYKVIVVGKYFTKYYGFEKPWNQNRSILWGIDTIGPSLLKPLRVDSLSSRDLIINPDSKKVIKAFFKNRFKNTYLRKERLSISTTENDEISTEDVNVKRVENLEVKIYPNPIRGGEVTIESDLFGFDNARLAVFNLSGQEIKCEQSPSSNSIKVNIEKLKSGSYFVVITNGDSRSSGEFVVIK